MHRDQLLHDMLCTFRRTLHAIPEAAHDESQTVRIVESFLAAYPADELIRDLGGHGLAAIYDGELEGPTVLVRCELDALGCSPTGSLVTSASHRCGHDGHMAIVTGLAPGLAHRRPARGRVVLLYQPAEETGEGALAVIEDSRFATSIHPDFAMALHNLPGVPEGTVVLRNGTFSCASVGMMLRLQGVAGHAAEPELANSPNAVLSRLLVELPTLGRPESDGLRMITVTHAQLGTPSFGITPGHADVYCTLRATSQGDLEALKAGALGHTQEVLRGTEITMEVQWFDEFPATGSDDGLVDLLERTSQDLGIPVKRARYPHRWSEDFGHFSRVCPSLYFGLGMGEAHPPLHHPAYVFADSQIAVGVHVFEGMVRHLLDAGLPDQAG